MKFHILTELKEEPWGGGNQFLKALKLEGQRNKAYAEKIEEAQIILFNSHHNPSQVMNARKKFKDHIFVHRVDGPMSYRGEQGEKLDKKIFFINSLVADGTVFQSKWSKFQTIKENHEFSSSHKVIWNAPNKNIFFTKEKEKLRQRKIKLISSSWSNNPMKGLKYLHHLDNTLDFNRYSMSFAGNTDKPFQNIRMLGRLNSIELADKLRAHDVFIFTSEREACSNSLLEALHCGLPVLCKNSSSNPEILGKGGLLFNDADDMLEKLDKLVEALEGYQDKIQVKTISEIFEDYMEYFSSIKLNREKEKINLTKKLRFKLNLI